MSSTYGTYLRRRRSASEAVDTQTLMHKLAEETDVRNSCSIKKGKKNTVQLGNLILVVALHSKDLAWSPPLRTPLPPRDGPERLATTILEALKIGRSLTLKPLSRGIRAIGLLTHSHYLNCTRKFVNGPRNDYSNQFSNMPQLDECTHAHRHYGPL